MIRMLISNNGNTIIIGTKVGMDQTDLSYVELKKPSLVQFIKTNTENEVVPILIDYPMPFIKSILTEKAINERMHIVKFNKDEYNVYDEEEISAMFVNWYYSELGKRSGIEIVNDMPKVH